MLDLLLYIRYITEFVFDIWHISIVGYFMSFKNKLLKIHFDIFGYFK